MANLKQTVREHIADPAVAGLVIETTFEPLAGRGTPVAPPTYARETSDRSKAPLHAFSRNAFVPKRDRAGWYSEIEHDSNGVPRLASRVVIDSYAAQSGRTEEGVWNGQERLGIALPALIVGDEGSTGKKAGGTLTDCLLDDALGVTVSSWEAAHRHADAWIRFATQAQKGDEQVWESEQPDSVKALITRASAQNAEVLYRYFPNSAIYGFWLSSGAARHKLPRAYSSEIVGYGAHPITSGATKLDPAGGASKDSQVLLDENRLSTVGEGSKAKPKGAIKPSNAGLGQVPSQPFERSYVCELILQQSSLSLSVLRSLRFETSERTEAALTVLTLLAMAGHYLGREEGFLRSGCALVPQTEKWGWKRAYAETEAFEVSGLDEIAQALREAVDDARSLGLTFADPIRLSFSAAQRQLIEQRVAEQGKQAETGTDA